MCVLDFLRLFAADARTVLVLVSAREWGMANGSGVRLRARESWGGGNKHRGRRSRRDVSVPCALFRLCVYVWLALSPELCVRAALCYWICCLKSERSQMGLKSFYLGGVKRPFFFLRGSAPAPPGGRPPGPQTLAPQNLKLGYQQKSPLPVRPRCMERVHFDLRGSLSKHRGEEGSQTLCVWVAQCVSCSPHSWT